MSEHKKHFSNFQTVSFVLIVCFLCALILSVLNSGLRSQQARAEQLYRSKQLLIAAKLLSYNNTFTFPNQDGTTRPAHIENGKLAEGAGKKATDKDILEVYTNHVTPFLTSSSGQAVSFQSAGIDEKTYMEENQKRGFSRLKEKLVYGVYFQGNKQQLLPADEYVIPINGFGLWDAIYGFLSLARDANTIVGTTWYQQAETPGLGGDISLPEWQKQFDGKQIFQKSANGQVDFSTAPLGIIIVKTTVQDELGASPKADSAVDGVSGAKITMKGVAEAYTDVLTQYRPFLITAHGAAR